MTESLNKIIDGLVDSAAKESSFIGHPDVLKGLKWQEVLERDGRDLLVKEDNPSEPAVFWTVAEISPNDFWLYADGRWNDKLKKEFWKHEGSASFVRPRDKRLGELFDTALEGAKEVQNFVKSQYIPIGNPLIKQQKHTPEHYLNLKHRVFDRCRRKLVKIEEDDTGSAGGDCRGVEEKWARLERNWTLENWPCITPEADFQRTKYMNDKQFEYKPRLLEAYDEDEQPIPPDMYRQKLRGATVSCYFSITRWHFKNQYTFVPHLVQMWTLIPPAVVSEPTSSTPKRRLGSSEQDSSPFAVQEVPERDGRSLLVKKDNTSEPAVFWTVAEISPNDFWLYADGRWNDKLEKEFWKHEGSASFVRPRDRRLGKLFDDALEGAKEVQNFDKSPYTAVGHPLIKQQKYTPEQYLKLKHRRCPRKIEDDDESNQRILREGDNRNAAEEKWARLERNWTLENWPCITQTANLHRTEYMRDRQFGYKPRLLEAYDEDDQPIPPDMYCQKLRGATVSCYFSITRWHFKNQPYTFVTHIVQIWTLIPPVVVSEPTSSTPKRRLGESTSPRKRMRGN
ncbi:hypothetical protein D9758_006412 [Tetrapyrgos nigripes]|uniref:Uncharacterized protein n=1 Tax=Tetrapyrgos nigripes TaxID=182062 RepID=A0A8H5D978_9AGAR|nr:hypothetical protein D9758_006412 [Tetrapyrgos nigripes]